MIGSPAFGAGASFAYGNERVVVAVLTANAFLLLLKLTDRIFIATPRIPVPGSTRELVAKPCPSWPCGAPGPISRRVCPRDRRGRVEEDGRLSTPGTRSHRGGTSPSRKRYHGWYRISNCLLYTSDAADDLLCVD